MTKLFTAANVMLLLGVSCISIGPTTNNRYEAIRKLVTAITNYDTLELYQLIDTSQYFSVCTKANFLGKVDYVRARLKNCDNHFDDSAIKVEKVPAYQTKYTVVFCSLPGVPADNSFKLICRFADYRKGKRMNFMDVEVNRVIKPTMPAPTGY